MEEKYELDRAITKTSLLKFALPTIITVVILSIYDIINGIIVSRLINNTALSAITIVMPIGMFAHALGMMLATGGSAIVARKMGEGKELQARKNFSMLFTAAILCGVILTIAGSIFIKPTLQLLGASGEVYTYCLDYARVKMLLFPLSMLSMFFQVFLIAVGKTTFGMMIMLGGGLTNILFDYILIGEFHVGIVGAALASGIGLCVPVLSGLAFFGLKRGSALYFVKPEFDMGVLIKSCTNGISEMVTSLSQCVTIALFNNVLMRMVGKDGVTSVTIAIYAYSLFTAIFMGYSMGTSPIISFNYGRKNKDYLQKIYRYSRQIIFIAGFLMFLSAMLLSRSLVSIFTPMDSSLYGMATHGFRLFSICIVFMGFSIYGSAMFTAYSNGRVSAIISVMRTLVFIVAALLLLPLIFDLNGVWIAMPVAEFLGLLVTLYFTRRNKTKYNYA